MLNLFNEIQPDISESHSNAFEFNSGCSKTDCYRTLPFTIKDHIFFSYHHVCCYEDMLPLSIYNKLQLNGYLLKK